MSRARNCQASSRGENMDEELRIAIFDGLVLLVVTAGARDPAVTKDRK